tara:strand:+ start:575 stop:724 length:150 start_codon:yes stop_codon:yes gene_type:complete
MRLPIWRAKKSDDLENLTRDEAQAEIIRLLIEQNESLEELLELIAELVR